MQWMTALAHLRRSRLPGVLVTLAQVRGHSPRPAGAKMVVAAEQVWDTIGGGNLEAVAIDAARELLRTGGTTPEMLNVSLSDKAPLQFGVQCCGGEVTVLLDPVPVAGAVAIFGMGHVGLELARILARHEVHLTLVDSRAEQLTEERLAVLSDAVASVHVRHEPLTPERAIADLPAGAHVLVMTHDHAEDLAICDAALRTDQLGSIGLIGSSAKWARFTRTLTAEYEHDRAELERITTPIGRPDIAGKEPAVIALSVAADLIVRLHAEAGAGTP
ncbi:MAG TPA: xanthine dehydrogenase accessory protein XdhC [Candidatus Ruania gallistercoris]|uniref:Xanthine dehydrogenase accessory protein XdhC n=2 Tax=Candidatus Ruania gallistercoris TaxID=2838746 RepID=A0A9D2EHN0_9MICO|nr:xanthine dehydrogenase accessory protein XdhC [Candidatus Ruania gallistercoris]